MYSHSRLPAQPKEVLALSSQSRKGQPFKEWGYPNHQAHYNPTIALPRHLTYFILSTRMQGWPSER